MRTYVRSVRMGAAVAGLAAALVLTGCSSDGDGDGDSGSGGGKKDRGSAAGSSSSGGSGSGSDDEGSTGGSSGSGGKGGSSLEGTWVTTADGKPLALAVSGKTATLLGEDVLCSGTAGEKMGTQMINLTCPKGDSDRTEGRIESVDGKSLKVAWEGAGTDEFLKTEGTKLPEGLPTAGMPQS
ncbi:hypothetical protein ABZ953_20455 [Streptomyces sp. NPDC046465]|uniref:hypothetical protein n=1 Tax=Streptomyces sp. NPDC046465 TaxID=3155810 RepID=UPI0033C08DF1